MFCFFNNYHKQGFLEKNRFWILLTCCHGYILLTDVKRIIITEVWFYHNTINYIVFKEA